MEKSPDAFRTISEVADLLDVPAHVLRFWETRFPQVRPVKRAGGRRYYRPGDVALLAGLRLLLHDQGMTIRGAQKILREQGVRHVMGLGATTGPLAAEAVLPPVWARNGTEGARIVPLAALTADGQDSPTDPPP
ncbi:MAG: MerR family transcriptional regulator, partial [Rhodobacterales bacterium]|nr:MerR family transcriptional regulator [Rhodobacterales bacterium]